ncbi:MAG: L-histidine N(alpha)-methyltransferase, partial [Planctomycetota bacterium]
AARASIARDYPAVEFMGVEGTFEEALPLLASLQPKLIFFLGSTIGNLTENECEPFWSQVTGSMAEGDHFLLGVDLVKDPSVLAAAYNDAAGVTARFTKNLFVRMNRELDTSIDLDAVQHEARWSPERERIETHAAFLERQTIELDGRRFEIEAGERVLVEISRKFRIETLSRELERFGLHRIDTFTDERDWFALLLLRRGAPGPG